MKLIHIKDLFNAKVSHTEIAVSSEHKLTSDGQSRK